MPEKFKLNKTTKPGICDAKRCEAEHFNIYPDGTKLCKKHINMMTEKELYDLVSTEPAKPDTQESQVKAEIQPIEEEALTLAEQLAPLEIVDEESAEMVGQLLKETHDNLKAIESKRKEATKPLMEAKKAIDGWFKPAKKALEDVKTLLKGKTLAWVQAQEKARQEALDSGDVSRALTTPEAVAPSTTRTRKVWKFEVTDLSIVPREYLAIDASAIGAEMDRTGPENVQIPGIRVYQHTDIVMGR